jgi:hypothetical protein
VLVAQDGMQRLHLLDAGRLAEIHHQQARVRRLQRGSKPWQRMLRRHGRQVHELEVHVLVRHHARLRKLGRERIGRDLGVRTGQARVQRGFPGVGRPDQRELRRTLGPDDERRPAARGAALLRRLDFLGQFLDAALDIRLQVVGALVLGDGAQHLAQAIEPLARIARLAERGFGGLVLRAEVGRHPDSVTK